MCTCIDSDTSNILDIDYEIPQGYILGLILFTIYIYDLGEMSTNL